MTSPPSNEASSDRETEITRGVEGSDCGPKPGYVTPYLNFNGRCEEALQFYQQTLQAEVQMLMRYHESPDPETQNQIPPGTAQKVMHASFRIGASQLMASDGACAGSPNFEGVSLSLSLATRAEAERTFAALAVGGTIEMPLMTTFWSPAFGMVKDRFGVSWMITVASESKTA